MFFACVRSMWQLVLAQGAVAVRGNSASRSTKKLQLELISRSLLLLRTLSRCVANRTAAAAPPAIPVEMAKPLAIKTKRRSTAAYAASQPLFDAFRDGMECLGEQRANLEIARDTVQRLHVKLPSSSIADDTRDSHERYMDAAVKAWRLATENYAVIFETLADVTAADPSSGRKESQGHAAFLKMAHTAQAALDAAMDWKMSMPPRSKSAESDTQIRGNEDEDEDMEDVDATQVGKAVVEHDDSHIAPAKEQSNWLKSDAQSKDNRPTNSILQGLLDKRATPNTILPADEDRSKVEGARESRKSTATSVTNEKNGIRAQKHAEKSDKRKEKKAKRETAAIEGEAGNVTKNVFKFEQGREAPPGFVEGNDKLAPNVKRPPTPKHDDVSAEVAARLKAKEPKKDAKKEKKRKRESADSNQTAVVKAEKPKKKKARSNEGEVVEDAASKERARKHEREGQGVENGGDRKKRKKV